MRKSKELCVSPLVLSLISIPGARHDMVISLGVLMIAQGQVLPSFMGSCLGTVSVSYNLGNISESFLSEYPSM
jgi:hypothetical protein